MSKQYILNKETSKIELHFSKEEYNNLNDNEKKILRSAYLFSGKSQAWVSRSKNNHYSAIQAAKKLGFIDGGTTGNMLSFEENLLRQQEKAEYKQEKYLGYADNAERKAESLQSEFNERRGDISYLTQPVITGHRGSEAFAKQRQRVMDRYNKGFEEYRKSEYFVNKAEDMQSIINQDKFKDRKYLVNRIDECNKNIKAYESNIVYYEEKENEEKIQYWLEKTEHEINKLAYMENCLQRLGGNFTKENLKVGYEVKIRGEWGKILKLNIKTVEFQPLEENIKMFISKRDYKEIEEVKIPKNLEIEEIKNPYNVGDIVTFNSYVNNKVINAYKVIKTTDKTVTIKELELSGDTITDNFKEGAKELRRQFKKSKYNDTLYIVNNGYQLYKYIA